MTLGVSSLPPLVTPSWRRIPENYLLKRILGLSTVVPPHKVSSGKAAPPRKRLSTILHIYAMGTPYSHTFSEYYVKRVEHIYFHEIDEKTCNRNSRGDIYTVPYPLQDESRVFFRHFYGEH